MPKDIVVVGSLSLDLVVRVPRHPVIGETLTGSDFHRFVGGKGANQAVAASLLGGKVSMIGRHGSDGFETELLTTLSAKGVDTTHITLAEGPSGMALILVSEAGDNTIVVMPGSNGELSESDMEKSRSEIESAGIVLTQLETPISSLRATLEIAAGAGVPVMLDPAPAMPLAEEIMAQVDWLTPNETELAILLREVPLSDAQLQSFAERLLVMGPRNVLLKLGARGAYLATNSGLREHVPAPVVDSIDSTAAGDALNGALAVSLVAGADPVEAVRFGVTAASISVTRLGAIPSLPSLQEVKALLGG